MPSQSIFDYVRLHEGSDPFVIGGPPFGVDSLPNEMNKPLTFDAIDPLESPTELV